MLEFMLLLHVPMYKDKDGDWMLVEDVLWRDSLRHQLLLLYHPGTTRHLFLSCGSNRWPSHLAVTHTFVRGPRQEIAHLFVVSEEVSQRREIEHAMCVFSLQPEGFRCTVVIKIWSLGSHGGLLPAIDVAKNLCHMEMGTAALHVDTKERSSGFKRVASLVILRGLPGSFF